LTAQLKKIGSIDDVILTFNRVLIQVEKHEDKVTESGLIIPTSATEKDFLKGGEGKIVKMGVLAFLDHENNAPKIGDAVITNLHSGFLYVDNNDNYYRLIKDTDVLSVVSDSVVNV
jgi:co-chaperonin GroES (HSP10)